MEEYTTSKVARQKIGVCNKTLRDWAIKGKIDHIRTEGGSRRYNLKKYMKDYNLIPKKKVCYARVSSYDRKEDLERQVSYLTEQYPTHEIIKDIGSGINFKRPGLQKIIDYAIKGELEEVVIAYKDRLCRIGYDLIEFIFEKYSNAKICIINKAHVIPQQEITDDLIEIVTVYSSKIHGRRSYTKDKKEV